MSDAQRRARLVVRHALHPEHRLDTAEAVTAALVVLHATDPATVHLSVAARSDMASVAGTERALYGQRSLVKQLAMRRTLFVFPRELLGAAWGSASARVAATERAQMAADVEKAGLVAAGGGDAWVDAARAEILALLRTAPDGLPAREVRRAVDLVDVTISVRSGSRWSGSSRMLWHLGLTADVVRGANEGHWRTSRPRWTLTRDWLGDGAGAVPKPATAPDGYRTLVERWLRRFGPGTEDDIVWWLGATNRAVRGALAELEAVPVSLERDRTGFLMPDDLDDVPDPGHSVALLPVLDPTTMGWRERGFYLGAHAAALFDRTGNGGTTAWVDGRIVGCWVQDDDAVVRVRPLEPLPARTRRALDAEAVRLTAWLDGVRIVPVIRVPAMAAA